MSLWDDCYNQEAYEAALERFAITTDVAAPVPAKFRVELTVKNRCQSDPPLLIDDVVLDLARKTVTFSVHDTKEHDAIFFVRAAATNDFDFVLAYLDQNGKPVYGIELRDARLKRHKVKFPGAQIHSNAPYDIPDDAVGFVSHRVRFKFAGTALANLSKRK
jgi:hypothetical protein